MRRKVIVILLIFLLLMPVFVRAGGIDIGTIVKIYGIGYLINQIAGPLNDFINKVTLNNNVPVNEATKVVPIVSFGTGAYIGAAQVAGPKSKVDEVKAVAQIETEYQKEIRIKILVPVNTTNPVAGVKRVTGVGVSAVIDIKV